MLQLDLITKAARLVTKFVSRKLLAAGFGVLVTCYYIVHVMAMGKSDVVTVAAIVSIALSVSVIIVTYITGLAKIDVSAQVNLNK